VRDILDCRGWRESRIRVWVAGPERIVTFDCASMTVYAETTRQRVGLDGAVVGVTRVPRRMVALDTHGRERTVYLGPDVLPQPVMIEQVFGRPRKRPDDGWLAAVQVWRLRRAIYPGQPEKWMVQA
jgi:hypothetical protein